ncbi:MAG: hypothetical protein QM820_23650 [Minicystis sp.]
MSFSNTPREITSEIAAFCGKIVAGGLPEFLTINSVHGAKALDCFPVVEEHVRRNGGSSCLGWRIWEWPGVLLEAEFHAVWRDAAGQLHDISPPPTAGAKRVLFLADPNATYHGRQVASIRQALSDDPNVALLIDAWDREFEFMNRGDRANQHGEIVIEGDERDELQEIQRQKLDAMMALAASTSKSIDGVGAKPPLTLEDARRARNRRKKQRQRSKGKR